jgi:hypothetical protein
MSTSEPARLDLYNGLTELLGPDRAETLMTYLPAFDPAEVATKSDILKLESRLESGLAGTNARLDRLFLAVLAGLFAIVAAMAGILIAVL